MDNRNLLKKSLTLRYYRNQILICPGILLFYVVLRFLRVRYGFWQEETYQLFMIALLIIGVVFCIYYGIRMILLMRNADRYVLLTAHAGEKKNFGRKVSFSMTAVDEDGTELLLNSGSIFTTGATSALYFGNYFNQDLRVLYDVVSKRVAVIDAVGA